MKIIGFIVLSILFGCNISYCQIHFVSLSDVEITLSKEPFNVVKVIDARADKTTIGWVQKGMFNAVVNANFAHPLEKVVTYFLKKNLKTKGPEIHLVVRKLQISEKTSFSKEQGFCEMSVDFLLEKESQLYRVLRTSVVTETTGLDVTGKHKWNIADAFKECFKQLSDIDLSDTANFIAINLDEYNADAADDSIYFNFPLFKEKINNGLYATYEELKNNLPSNTEPFTIEKKERVDEPWLGTYEIFPIYNESGKKIKKVWAIAYEGEIYVYHVNEFFPLVVENNELYFYGYGYPRQQNITTGAVIGGLIGAGIASAIETAHSKKQKVKYTLDLGNGRVKKAISEKEVK